MIFLLLRDQVWDIPGFLSCPALSCSALPGSGRTLRIGRLAISASVNPRGRYTFIKINKWLRVWGVTPDACKVNKNVDPWYDGKEGRGFTQVKKESGKIYISSSSRCQVCWASRGIDFARYPFTGYCSTHFWFLFKVWFESTVEFPGSWKSTVPCG